MDYRGSCRGIRGLLRLTAEAMTTATHSAMGPNSCHHSPLLVSHRSRKALAQVAALNT